MKPARSTVSHRSALCVMWLASASAAGAPGTPGATLVLVGAPYPAFERELSAEAREVGLTVVRDTTADPARALEAHDAVAVLDVQSPVRVDVWITEPEDHRTVVHELLTAGASSHEPFAARVIEQVRAHLVRLSLLPAKDPDATPVAQATPPVAEPPSAVAPATKPIAKETPPPNDTGEDRRSD